MCILQGRESFRGEGEAEARAPGCLCWLPATHASVRILLDSDLLFAHVGILAVVSVDISYFPLNSLEQNRVHKQTLPRAPGGGMALRNEKRAQAAEWELSGW